MTSARHQAAYILSRMVAGKQAVASNRVHSAHTPKLERIGAWLRTTMLVGALSLSLAACQSPEERLASFTDNGQSFLAEENYVRASLEFRNALQINPEYAPALAGLAASEAKRGNEAAAVSFYTRAVAQDSGNLDYRVAAMRLMLKLALVQELDTLSEESLELFPENADVLALRASFYMRLGQSNTAVELAKKALEADPAKQEALVVLSAERMRAGDVEGALAYLDTSLQAVPNDPEIRLLKIRIYRSVENYTAAEVEYKKLIELYPDRAAFKRGYALMLIAAKRDGEAELLLRQLVADMPEDLQAKLDVVRLANVRGGTDAAIAELQNQIEKGFLVTDLRFALAEVYRGQNKLAEAEAVTQQIIDATQDTRSRLRAMGEMGVLKLAQGDEDGAQAMIKALLREDERNADALLLRAEIATRSRNLDAAIADLRSILIDEPYSAETALALARVHDLQGAVNLAETQYAQAFRYSSGSPATGLAYANFLLRKNDAERAEAVLLNILSRTPSELDVLRLLAQIRLRNQDWEGARQVADLLEKYGEQDYVVGQIEAVVAEAQDRTTDEGIELMRRAFEDSPEEARPLASLIQAYLRRGKLDEAEAFLKKLIEKEDKPLRPTVMLAELSAARGKQDEAVALFDDAMALSDGSLYPYRAAYTYYARRGDIEAADATLARALDAGVDRYSVDVLRAEVMQLRADYDSAIKLYESLLADNPNAPVIANNLASLLSDHRDDKASHQRARELAERFRDSQVPQFKDTLGWVLYRLGEYDAAVAILSEAQEANPGLVDIRYHYGKALLAQGNLRRARSVVEETLKLLEGRTGDLIDALNETLADIEAAEAKRAAQPAL